MGADFFSLLALLLAATAALVTSAASDSPAASSAVNVAHATASIGVEPHSVVIVQPSGKHYANQKTSAAKSTNTYVQQSQGSVLTSASYSVEQPTAAVHSSSGHNTQQRYHHPASTYNVEEPQGSVFTSASYSMQQPNATVQSLNGQSSQGSVITSASYSVQQPNTTIQPSKGQSFKQRPSQSTSTYNVQEPQKSALTYASYSVQQPSNSVTFHQPKNAANSATFSVQPQGSSVQTSASYRVQQLSGENNLQQQPLTATARSVVHNVQQQSQGPVLTSAVHSVQQQPQHKTSGAQARQKTVTNNYYNPQYEAKNSDYQIPTVAQVSTPQVYPYRYQQSSQNNVYIESPNDVKTASATRPASRPYPIAASNQINGVQQRLPMRQRVNSGPYRPYWMGNRRQHFEGPLGPPVSSGISAPGPHLSIPRPPPSSGPIYSNRPPSPSGPSFNNGPTPGSPFNKRPQSGPPFSKRPPVGPSFNSGPQHFIYSKPPPEVIYYGPNPPPLDYSPPRPYRPRPIVTSPVHYSSPQEPEDHDIMNDLDMYIPDEEPPSRIASSSGGSSVMSQMMMPLMLLGVTLPALGFAFTYLSKRRRRRRDITADSSEELDRYMTLLLKAIEKSKKNA